MAKKIRFPLEMDNGIEVRDMEELRDNFSLSRVLHYIDNGKMLVWLRDRYLDDVASAIENLNRNAPDFAKNVSLIFDIPYDEEMEKELNAAAERKKRIEWIKKFTNDEKVIMEIDNVAFNQDELYDLLDEDASKIYLCGDKFSIPLSKSGVSYIGINNPIVVINSKEKVDWNQKQISIEGVFFDEKYQAIVDGKDKEKPTQKVVEMIRDTADTVRIGDYSDKTYLSFMIPSTQRQLVKQMYEMARPVIEKLNYDVDEDIQIKKGLVHKYQLIGMASNYLSSL